MPGEMKIELHSNGCSCRGGAWVLMGDAASPCSGSATSRPTVVAADEWRSLGKPGNAELYQEVKARAQAGDRREFKRFRAMVPVRLARLASRSSANPQTEDTYTQVIASGGALVLTRMPVEQGETLSFEVPGRFKTRAQVAYVTVTETEDGKVCLCVGLRFLEGLLPQELVPADATPV